MALNITACALDLHVQGIFALKCQQSLEPAIRQYAQAAAEAAAESAALAYGGPAVFVGTTWPLLIISLVISSWRLKTKPSPRAILLFVACVINVCDTANSTYGKMISPIVLQGDNATATAYYYMLIIFGQYRCAIIFAAASYRFAAVYTDPNIHRWVTMSMCGFAAVASTANVAIGVHEYATTLRVSKLFWGLLIILPLTYIVLGIGVFSFVLWKAQREVRAASSNVMGEQASTMSQLQNANNILMVLTIICAATVVGVTQALDADSNQYVIPVTLFCNTLWSLMENCFELLARAQTHPAPQSSGTKTIGSYRRDPSARELMKHGFVD
ncbi:hypothetical protein HDU89_005920 [Geranomyces variabilis]|nr:hypothetical protein HDU89_005920 [Geranomyces variabilis]